MKSYQAKDEVTSLANLLDKCSKTLSCATTESHLLQNYCSVIVAEGKYLLAWVGFALQDKKKTVKPMACEGFDKADIEQLSISWADEGNGRGPTGTAIRTGKPCVARNSGIDPVLSMWNDQARRYGYESSISLPLTFGSDVIGALNVYSSRADAFNDTEVNLLMQVANDLAFGIKSCRSRVTKRNSDDELKRREAYFRSIIENSQDIITVLNNDGTIQFESKAIEQVLGYKPEELVGKNVFEFIHLDEQQNIIMKFLEGIQESDHMEMLELRFKHKDGTWRFLEAKAKNLLDKSEITGVVISSRDITDRKQNEIELRTANQNLLLLQADFEELFLSTMNVLSNALDAKSRWTAGHSERVTRYAVSMGKEMGIDEKSIKELEIAALLHDIGKIETYLDLLDKKERLSEDAIKLIMRHPVRGAEILSLIKQLKNIISAIKHHHDHYDGTGYPDGLKGDAIPFYSRIIAIADSVDAMYSDRPYRQSLQKDEIIAELNKESGKQFDPEIVKIFLSLYTAKDWNQ